MTNNLDQLIQKGGQIAISDADTLCSEIGCSRQEFCDIFARRVAHQYNDNALGFEAADLAMNWLWEFAIHQMGAPIPPYFLDVYLAFDRGEYVSSADPPDSDPELRYTRPLINEIVAKDRAAARV